MQLYAKPSESIEVSVEAGTTGLVGTLGVQVINVATDVATIARTTAGISEVPAGSGLYFVNLPAPSIPGSYIVLWDKGSITPASVAYDLLTVNAEGVAPAPSEETTEGNLISLAQLKASMGIAAGEVDIVRDEKLEQAIAFASVAIRSYSDRAFGTPAVKGTRIYEYDSSGYLDIDDAMSVESLAFIFGSFETPIETVYWRAEPQEGPPYSYLTVPHWAGSIDPEMGFRYNLDVVSKDKGWPGLIPTIKVNGEFGWPDVPADVQQAAIWTAAAMAEKPDQMVSESIAGYSYTSSNRTSSAVTAIPSRAKDLLAAYERFQV
jgi:hypothetical protein